MEVEAVHLCVQNLSVCWVRKLAPYETANYEGVQWVQTLNGRGLLAFRSGRYTSGRKLEGQQNPHPKWLGPRARYSAPYALG